MGWKTTMGRNEILTIEKQTALEKYDVPTITYCISTNRDDTFRIRLRERIPDSCLPADFEFHPWYDVDDWKIEGGGVIFEQRIEPDDEILTLFSVRMDENGDLSSLVERPVIEIAPAETDGDGADVNWVEVPDEYVDFRIADEEARIDPAKILASDGGEFPSIIGEREDSAGTERADGESPEIEDISSDGHESVVPTTREPAATGEEGMVATNEAETNEDGGVSSGSQPPPEESIVADLTTALQREDVSEEQIQTLREVVGSDAIGSLNARIEHCQTRLSDLEAYTDAFETFLDEEGTGQRLIAGFRCDLEAVEDHVEEIESAVTQTTNGQEELHTRVGEVEREVADLREIGATVESLETRLHETTASLREDLDELQTSIDDVKDWQERIVGAFVDTDLVEET